MIIRCRVCKTKLKDNNFTIKSILTGLCRTCYSKIYDRRSHSYKRKSAKK